MRDLDRSLNEAYTNQVAEGAAKTYSDLVRYRLIIDALRPALIVETGTYNGCSALWFARTASDCDVITVDIDGVNRVPDIVLDAWERQTNIVSLRGDSIECSGEVRYVWTPDDGSAVLVSLDSAHDADHVYREMNAYAPLVPPGSYMVVEDTLIRHMTGPLGPDQYGGTSPADAVERFMAERDDFVNDLLLEDVMPTTQHPGGWLRRRA